MRLINQIITNLIKKDTYKKSNVSKMQNCSINNHREDGNDGHKIHLTTEDRQKLLAYRDTSRNKGSGITHLEIISKSPRRWQ